MNPTSERYLRNIRRVTDLAAVIGIAFTATTGNTSYIITVAPAICMWLYIGLIKLML